MFIFIGISMLVILFITMFMLAVAGELFLALLAALGVLGVWLYIRRHINNSPRFRGRM